MLEPIDTDGCTKRSWDGERSESRTQSGFEKKSWNRWKADDDNHRIQPKGAAVALTQSAAAARIGSDLAEDMAGPQQLLHRLLAIAGNNNRALHDGILELLHTHRDDPSVRYLLQAAAPPQHKSPPPDNASASSSVSVSAPLEPPIASADPNTSPVRDWNAEFQDLVGRYGNELKKGTLSHATHHSSSFRPPRIFHSFVFHVGAEYRTTRFCARSIPFSSSRSCAAISSTRPRATAA